MDAATVADSKANKAPPDVPANVELKVQAEAVTCTAQTLPPLCAASARGSDLMARTELEHPRAGWNVDTHLARVTAVRTSPDEVSWKSQDVRATISPLMAPPSCRGEEVGAQKARQQAPALLRSSKRWATGAQKLSGRGTHDFRHRSGEGASQGFD